MIDRDHLTEEQAARLWQRAAALQTEAARKAESQWDRRQVTAGAQHTEDSNESGYAIEHVRAAAIEAGIGVEYLDAALGDLNAEGALAGGDRRGILTRWMMTSVPDAITTRRVIEATPREVLDAMEEIFSAEPYRLSLSEKKGNVLEGGVLVFDVSGVTTFSAHAASADIRQIYLSIRSLDDGSRCEVTLRGPIAWALKRNTGLGAVIVAAAGGAGLGVAWAAGGSLAAAIMTAGIASIPVAGAVAAGVAVAGFVGGSAAGKVGFRALYEMTLRHGETMLDDLISALAVSAQGGWALGIDETGGISPTTESAKLSSGPGERGPA